MTDSTAGSGLLCYYCQIFDNKKTPATFTAHDKRGCNHVCFEHTRWRMNKNWIFGHYGDCQFAVKK